MAPLLKTPIQYVRDVEAERPKFGTDGTAAPMTCAVLIIVAIIVLVILDCYWRRLSQALFQRDEESQNVAGFHARGSRGSRLHGANVLPWLASRSSEAPSTGSRSSRIASDTSRLDACSTWPGADNLTVMDIPSRAFRRNRQRSSSSPVGLRRRCTSIGSGYSTNRSVSSSTVQSYYRYRDPDFGTANRLGERRMMPAMKTIAEDEPISESRASSIESSAANTDFHFRTRHRYI